MDDQENYDPGIINTIVDNIRDRRKPGRPDEEAIDERMSGSVEGLTMGGMADGNEYAAKPTPSMADGGADVENRGNFGNAHDIAGDNTAVKNAAGGFSGEALAKGPANTDPDIASGGSGV